VTRAFEIDRNGFVALPTRRGELECSFLYQSLRVRAWPDPGDPKVRFLELRGGETDDALDAACPDQVVLRVDADTIGAIIAELMQVHGALLTGEVRR
jgi:hypothetical protein